MLNFIHGALLHWALSIGRATMASSSGLILLFSFWYIDLLVWKHRSRNQRWQTMLFNMRVFGNVWMVIMILWNGVLRGQEAAHSVCDVYPSREN